MQQFAGHTMKERNVQSGRGLATAGSAFSIENCQKFSRRSALQRFEDVGLRPTAWYTDDREWYSLVELRSA